MSQKVDLRWFFEGIIFIEISSSRKFKLRLELKWTNVKLSPKNTMKCFQLLS